MSDGILTVEMGRVRAELVKVYPRDGDMARGDDRQVEAVRITVSGFTMADGGITVPFDEFVQVASALMGLARNRGTL